MRIIRLIIYESPDEQRLERIIEQSIQVAKDFGNLVVTTQTIKDLDLTNLVETASKLYKIIQDHENIVGNTFTKENKS